MSVERHLVLQELTLPPSAEWFARSEGWLVVLVADGNGYWLSQTAARELNRGDMFVAPRNSNGLLRASRLGALKLQFFFVQPRLLNGLLPMADGQQLDTASSPAPAEAMILSGREPLAREFAELASHPPRSGLSLRCRLLQIWADAVAGLVRPAAEVSDPCDLRERFRQMLSQMSQAELSACSLGDIAGQLHCSGRHLSRLFREEYGVPFRVRQTELRLLRARQILADSNAKIINVAYDSGYRHLGLFNTMFKKRFGMTPSEWRLKATRKTTRAFPLMAAILVSFLLAGSTLFAAETNSEPASDGPVLYLGTPVSPEAMARAQEALRRKMSDLDAEAKGVTNLLSSADTGPKFEVTQYDVRGNTLLKKETLNSIFADAKGTNVSLVQIRQSLANLQMAYRERGYYTVAVTLPPQQISNATVMVQVTEAPLTSITIVGNRYFSSNNIMRALPILQDVNIWKDKLLNSQVFQRELDLANANRDRQIYPVLGPGPDPGTSELTLRVKERFPLHGRAEVNNQYTPGTPPLRFNVNGQYGNLWNLEHQLGLQYSFTPEQLKVNTSHNATFLDDPLIANYSGYYRLPLGSPASVQEQIDAQPLSFGYNEASHQFQLPPPSGRAELNIYGSRSTTDTAVKFAKPELVTQTAFITIISQDTGEDVTLNEGLGANLSAPLPEKAGVRGNFSVGFDFKRYRLGSFNTNNFFITTIITNSSGSQTIEDTVSSGQPPRRSAVDYFPLNAGFSFTIPGKSGATFLNASVSFNPLRILSGDSDFSQAAYTTNARAGYVKLTAGMTREVRIYRDWSVLLHADGQWADGPLIGNEQYALGGLAGVRGYLDGAAYGDSGWRVQIEPRTPLYNIGMVDNDVPFWVRGSVFLDLGKLYTSSGNRIVTQKFSGVGFALSGTVGEHLDARLTVGWPLQDTPFTKAGDPHVYFALGAQF